MPTQSPNHESVAEDGRPANSASRPAAAPEPELVLQRYLGALLGGDRDSATDIILRAAERGLPADRIYLEVLQPALHELGRLWEANRISIAEEHYCTAATQLVMSQLYPRIFSSCRIGQRFMGACVDGDQHEIGIRMVCDFFAMHGWDTYYIGASVPIADLLRGLDVYRPGVLGLSVTLTANLATAEEMIRAAREMPGQEELQVIVGGHAFAQSPDLWRELGADGCAADAEEAVRLCMPEATAPVPPSADHGNR